MKSSPIPFNYPAIFRIALPAAISGVIEPIISLVDTLFVGKISDGAIAAVGVASSLFLLQVWILGQGKSALSALVSQHHGRAQHTRVRYFSFLAILFITAISLIISLLAYMGSSELLSLYGISDSISADAAAYFEVRIWGLPFALFTLMGFGFFRGLQNTKIAMITSLIGGVSNVVLDYLFIVHLKWGIEGAAWASLASQMIMTVYIGTRLLPELKVAWKMGTQMKGLLLQFWNITYQLFFRTFILNLVYFFANRKSALLGDSSLAAHTIAMNIWLFSSFFLDGFANASNAIGGALYGQRNTPALTILKQRILLLGGGTGIILGLLYYFGFPVWKDWFSRGVEVQQELKSILFYLAIIQGVNGLAFGLDGFYKGFGKARFLRNVLFISSVALFAPALQFSPTIGLAQVWLALNLWMLGRFFLPWIYFKKHTLFHSK